MVYHIDWSLYVDISFHFTDKSQQIMVYDPFNVLLNFLVCIFLRISTSILIRSTFFSSFSFGVLFWFWYQGNVGFRKSVWKCSLLFNCFGRLWEELALILKMFSRINQWNHMVLVSVCWKVFDYWFSIKVTHS